MKSETLSFYEAAVCRAVVLVYEGLDDALDLGALAKTAALSPLHFHRIFRFMVGETPLELHRRLRMERAALELSEGDAAITRIAFDAGYETHESFTRAFGDCYGASPSAFRQAAHEARAGCTRPPPRELAARSGVHYRTRSLDRSVPILVSSKGEFVMQVDLKDMPALRVAAVRHTGAYNRISEAFQKLGQLAGPAGLIRPPTTEMLALYHDAPEATPVDKLRSDAALTVPEDAELPAGTNEIRIPAGRYACTTHIGPYTGLGDVWSKLVGGWLPKSGHRVAESPSFEIYRNNPTNTAPEKLVTELYLPLA